MGAVMDCDCDMNGMNVCREEQGGWNDRLNVGGCRRCQHTNTHYYYYYVVGVCVRVCVYVCPCGPNAGIFVAVVQMICVVVNQRCTHYTNWYGVPLCPCDPRQR